MENAQIQHLDPTIDVNILMIGARSSIQDVLRSFTGVVFHIESVFEV